MTEPNCAPPALPRRVPGATLTDLPDNLDAAAAARVTAGLADRITAALACTPIYDRLADELDDPLLAPIPLTVHGADCCWCCRAGQAIHLPDDPCCPESEA